MYMPDNVRVPLSEFLLEYVDVPNAENMKVMPLLLIRQSIKLLLDSGVFTLEELRIELLRSKGIIIPLDEIIGAGSKE